MTCRGACLNSISGWHGVRAFGGAFVQNAHSNPPRPEQFAQANNVIFCASLDSHEQRFTFEANAPTQFADVIAEFDRIADRPRLEAQPSLADPSNYDGPAIVQQQDRPVKQPLMTRKSNGEFLSAAGRSQEVIPLELRA